MKLIILLVTLSFALISCSPENVEQEQIAEQESIQKKQENESFELVTGEQVTVKRTVEGMEQEVNVIQYTIIPYDISFQLDEIFADPAVQDNKVIFSTQQDMYQITLEVIENKDLDEVVAELQKAYEEQAYDEKSSLEPTPVEENNLIGKMQYFAFPMRGFYAYQVDEHVLVITYQYPEEGGDGMIPLLEDLRRSIVVK